MSEFIPFADDSSSIQLDRLVLENQGDRVAMYGQINFTQDQAGLAQAKQLLVWLTQMVEHLESQAALPKQLEQAELPTVDNPFES